MKSVSSSASMLGVDRFAERLDWLRDRAGLVRRGLRGIEKESLRIEDTGRLSRRRHPAALGAALTHPYITTDYSEALPEFVTPPQRTSSEAMEFLRDLHVFAYRHLDRELLWPASMPCVLNRDEEIPIAEYGASNAGMMKTVYRRGLGYRYGRPMQAIAGVHYNYSLPVELWPDYSEHERDRRPLQEFRSEQLMSLARNYRRCAWLVTYLFGASPAVCKSFRPDGHPLLTEMDRATWHGPYATSLRMSDLGYRNTSQGRLSISANSLAEYCAGLRRAVTTLEPRFAEIGVVVDNEYRQLNANVLQIENEYYATIRPKPNKASRERPLLALEHDGIDYIEVRTLDLSAADPVGVNLSELRFLEALLVFCLLAESPPISAEEQQEIDARDLCVAREGRRPGLTLVSRGIERPLVAWAKQLLEPIGEVAALLDADSVGYREATRLAREAAEDPSRTPSAAFLAALRDERATFFEYSLALARQHAAYFRGLALSRAREDALAQTAQTSLEEAAKLERASKEPFSAYLDRYFAAV